MPYPLLKYVALAGSVLVIWFYPQKEESAFSDCNSLELDTSDIDVRQNIEVTVNELLLVILFSLLMFVLHRAVRLRRTNILYNELKDVKFMQQEETFKSVCRQRLLLIDEIMKIHEDLLNWKPTDMNMEGCLTDDGDCCKSTTSDFTTEVEGTEDETLSAVTADAVGDFCELPSEIKRKIQHVRSPRSNRSSSNGSVVKSSQRFTL